MKRLLYCCLLLVSVCFSLLGSAQNSLNYAVTNGANASLVADRNGNAINVNSAPNLIANNAGSLAADQVPIGFDFYFMGRKYTHFKPHTHGVVGLGLPNSPVGILSHALNNDLTRTVAYPPGNANNAAVLAPFWDELRTPVSGATIRSVLIGSAPNRCRVIQFHSIIGILSGTATPYDGVFQIRIYETTSQIEYVYGTMAIGPNSNTVTASIGFTAGSADQQFLALENLSTFDFTATAANEPATQSLVNSSTVGPITALNSTADGSRRFFRFTPPVIAGDFTGVQLNDVTTSTMRLQWTDNFSNESFYTIYRSTDNINFTPIADLPANSNQYIATQLTNNTRYYWKVMAYTEGSVDSAQVVSETTRCNMSGLFTVGAGGNFTSLTQAFDSLRLKGMTGSIIFELQNNYNSSSETFPLMVPKPILCRQPSYSLTIRPAANASAVAITNNTSSPLLLLDSTENTIIDGRPGGAGSTKALTFTSNGTAVVLQNARGVTISHVNLYSISEAISFIGTSGSGSDNNIIDQCNLSGIDVHPVRPRMLIQSYVLSNVDNRNNEVRGCNLYNFKTIGINLAAGSKAWKINNNSFYSTIGVAPDSVFGAMIATADTGSYDLNIIEGNYFGGTAPQCGGSVMTIAPPLHYDIISASGQADVKGNYFRKLLFVSNVGAYNALLRGVFVRQPSPFGQNKPVLISNNIFGGPGAADSIAFHNYSGYQVNAALIGASSYISYKIENNDMRNIILRSSGNTLSNLSGIDGQGGDLQVYNNRIGSNITNGYISNHTNGTTNGVTLANGNVDLRNNTITGMRGSSVMIGISLNHGPNSGALMRIEQNTVSNLATAYTNPSGSSYFAVAGISVWRTVNGEVKNNHIYGLYATAGGYTEVKGIFGYNCSGSTTAFAGNRIHSLVADWQITGIELKESQVTLRNNMIRLGFDSLGNTILNSAMILGIVDDLHCYTEIRHNTIHIGGTGTGGTNGLNSSYCMMHFGRVYSYNNIFTNERNLAGHRNILLSVGTGINAPLSRYDYNIYNITGPESRFGYNSNIFDGNYATFDDWSLKTGHDLHSILADPNYVNRNGSAATGDLHLVSPTPAEGKGTITYSALDDADNEIRSNLTPVDIGADAGNFVLGDRSGPVITPDPISDHMVTQNQVLTIKIRDDSGVDTAGQKKPAVWLRRFYPDTSSWYHVPGHLLTGSRTNGTWQFTVNYTSLGLPVSGVDSIQCYFVARDIASPFNLGYSPLRNNNHSDVTVQSSAPYEWYKYKIHAPLSDTLYVGTGQQYTTLTSNLGAFQAINNGRIGPNGITIIITSDLLLETGVNRLSGYPFMGSGGPLKIITNTPVVKTVFGGGLTVPLITFDTCQNVMVDGSVNGQGRYLRFVNTHPSGSSTTNVFKIEDRNKHITLKNLVVESNAIGQKTEPNILLMYENDDILIRDCEIKNAVGNPGTPGNTMVAGIYSASNNTRMRVIGNHISNFSRSGIYLVDVGDSCIVDSNHVFLTATTLLDYRQMGIIINEFVAAGEIVTGGHIISNNYVGGSAPYCGGAPWTYNTSWNPSGFGKYILGISINSSPVDTSYIFNNTVQNFRINFTGDMKFGGIQATGLVNVGGRGANIVSDIVNSGTTTNQYDELFTVGIWSSGIGGSRIVNNTVSDISTTMATRMSLSGIYSSYGDSNAITIEGNNIHDLSCMGIQANAPVPYSIAGIMLDRPYKGFRVLNNTISNLRSSGTAVNALAAGIMVTGTSPSAKIVNEIVRNRISGIENLSASGGEINGIMLAQGVNRVYNNQVSLTNGNNQHPILITGIKDNNTSTLAGNSQYYFNSVYIGGNANAGNNSSYAFRTVGKNVISQFRNNILYNQRTGGTGRHVALGMHTDANPTIGWPAGGSDYNFMIANDTSAIAEWSVSGAMGMPMLRSVSSSDASSYSTLITNVPVDSFFVNADGGNLDIDTDHTQCWYINGKGLPVQGISGDFEAASGVRSTNIADGPVDIGSDEFNTSTDPPVLIVFGMHQPGGADTLVANGRIIGIINWANQGTLPTLGAARWYSGVWPNDVTNNGTISNARYMSSYLSIPATGGSGYSYNLTLFIDSSMLGKVTDATSMVINKRQSGELGSWQDIRPTIVDLSRKTITISNQTGFSEFTATDSVATLARGLKLPDFVIAPSGSNSTTKQAGTFTNFAFQVQNSGSVPGGAAQKYQLYLSTDTILTPGANNDLLLVTGSLLTAIPANSGLLHEAMVTIPCNVTPGTYSLFYVIDAQNEFAETNETNNTARAALTITACLATGIDDIDGLENFELAPNPTTGMVIVKMQLSTVKQVAFRVVDNAGRTVFTARPGNRIGQVVQPIDLRHNNGTVYYLETMIGNKTMTRKILVIR